MARLNNSRFSRSTVDPRSTRESTTDSLYRRPTPRPSFQQSNSDSRNDDELSETTPPSPSQISISSEKENPRERRQSFPTRGKDTATPGPSTVAMRSISGQNGNKRRRLEPRETPSATINAILSQFPHQEEDKEKGQQYYNWEQDEGLRKEVRQAIRNHHKELQDRKDDFKRDSSRMVHLLKEQDKVMENGVRQTSDATLDARFCVTAADIAHKHTVAETRGQGSLGVDIDEFVSKCISFMGNGGPLSPGDNECTPAPTQATQRQRRGGFVRVNDDDEEDANDGDAFAWHVLGEFAAYEGNRRPAVPSFLLGPLSVEKRVRNTQRTARQRRDPVAEVTKPQDIKADDLERNESSNLVSICSKLRTHLEDFVSSAGDKVQAEMPDREMDQDEARVFFKQHRLASNWEVSLFEYAVNPRSFAQTVENLFYISFLVKDGWIVVSQDPDGLPTIRLTEKQDQSEEQRGRGNELARHQAIFTIDMHTWEKLIDAFDIEEPLIPHRAEEATQLTTAGGWYA